MISLSLAPGKFWIESRPAWVISTTCRKSGETTFMAAQRGLTISGPASGFSSDYFEINSARIGSNMSISVTLPPGYGARSDKRYPVIYATDAYTNCAFTVAATNQLLSDRLRPIDP